LLFEVLNQQGGPACSRQAGLQKRVNSSFNLSINGGNVSSAMIGKGFFKECMRELTPTTVNSQPVRAATVIGSRHPIYRPQSSPAA
jgi:hypothetical protein